MAHGPRCCETRALYAPFIPKSANPSPFSNRPKSQNRASPSSSSSSSSSISWSTVATKEKREPLNLLIQCCYKGEKRAWRRAPEKKGWVRVNIAGTNSFLGENVLEYEGRERWGALFLCSYSFYIFTWFFSHVLVFYFFFSNA